MLQCDSLYFPHMHHERHRALLRRFLEDMVRLEWLICTGHLGCRQCLLCTICSEFLSRRRKDGLLGYDPQTDAAWSSAEDIACVQQGYLRVRRMHGPDDLVRLSRCILLEHLKALPL